MTERVGFKIEADVDAARARLDQFGDAGEDAGKSAADGMDKLADAEKRVSAGLDDILGKLKKLDTFKLTGAIANMRAYERAVQAAAQAGRGLPGFGGGGAAAGPGGLGAAGGGAAGVYCAAPGRAGGGMGEVCGGGGAGGGGREGALAAAGTDGFAGCGVDAGGDAADDTGGGLRGGGAG